MHRTWRELAAPIIAEVISSCGTGCDPAFVRKAISASYPFGERKYWPYKVWCDEVRRQLRLPRRPAERDDRQMDLPATRS